MGWWSVSMSLPQDAGWRLAGRSGPAGGMLLAEGWVGFGTVCVEMCINILYIFVYKRRKRKKKKFLQSVFVWWGGWEAACPPVHPALSVLLPAAQGWGAGLIH